MSFITFLPSEFDHYNLRSYNRRRGIRYLQVEVTTRCNLSCPSCIHGQNGIEPKTLSVEKFTEIVEGIPTLQCISFVGMGEALLFPKISELVAFCNKRSIKTAITTNGTVGQKRLNEAVRSGLDKLTISIDGHNDETFSYARGGAKLSTVLKFAATAVELSTHTNVEIWGGITLSRHNIKNLKEIISMIADTGIYNIYVESIHHWGYDFTLNDLSIFSLDYTYVTEKILESCEFAKSRSIALHIFDYERIFSKGIENYTRCGWPVDATVLRADGSVAPCCIQLQGDDRVSFGNVHTSKLNDIWLSRDYSNFASSSLSGEAPQYCQKCIYRAEFGE
ncbi:radical SAM protein (plasmid) [Roseibium aggregatum]|uniref:radical SAM protein n=1 Tax=Roseibium aggregatum TaxID=187304 RepID=UPI001E5E2F88|nr:radical SAM protein [Roseibium aggregatum]UES60273.1 radical SAM protein [Roseibium aggregatum]